MRQFSATASCHTQSLSQHSLRPQSQLLCFGENVPVLFNYQAIMWRRIHVFKWSLNSYYTMSHKSSRPSMSMDFSRKPISSGVRNFKNDAVALPIKHLSWRAIDEPVNVSVSSHVLLPSSFSTFALELFVSDFFFTSCLLFPLQIAGKHSSHLQVSLPVWKNKQSLIHVVLSST